MHKEIPILFSTAMVQAILDGRKSQTRRVIKESFNGCLTNGGPHPCPNEPVVAYPGQVYKSENEGEEDITFEGDKVTAWFHCSTLDSDAKCRYGKPGDVLWVRESWARFAGDVPSDVNSVKYQFKADTAENKYAGGWDNSWKSNEVPWWCKWKPSIHMPKEASRIWLQVEEILVERLWDITDEGARAEGISYYKCEHTGRLRYKDYMTDASGYGDPEHDYPEVGIARTSFCTLWEKINGVESWQANPWVWVIKFKVLSTTGKPADIK